MKVITDEEMMEFCKLVEARQDLFFNVDRRLEFGSKIFFLFDSKFEFHIKKHYGVWRLYFCPIGGRYTTKSLGEVWDWLSQKHQDFFIYHLDLLR